MDMYGIKGKVYDWIESFLLDRKQAVVVDGEKSTNQQVESGVRIPQGTVLGPVFFIVYIIDMVLRARSSKALTFADDTKLMKAIAQLLCNTLLQEDLHSVIQWSIANNFIRIRLSSLTTVSMSGALCGNSPSPLTVDSTALVMGLFWKLPTTPVTWVFICQMTVHGLITSLR